jgi:hypothetical protein
VAALQAIKLFGLEVPTNFPEARSGCERTLQGYRDYFRIADQQAAIMGGVSTSLTFPPYFNMSSNQSNMIWCSRLSLLTPQ